MGVTGGFNPKKMDSLKAIRCFKEAKESLECPYCKEQKMKEKMAEEKKEDRLPYILQDPRYTLEDVFLPAKSKLQIDEALAKIKNFHKQAWNWKNADCGSFSRVSWKKIYQSWHVRC